MGVLNTAKTVIKFDANDYVNLDTSKHRLQLTAELLKTQMIVAEIQNT